MGKILAFLPKNPKRDQNLQFTTLRETMSIPVTFIWESPPWAGDCPPYLSQMLIRNADINERSSRHGLLNLVCPRCKRESEGGRSFTVSTTRLWNMIPSNIRNKPSLISFKKAMFDYFKDTHKHLDHFTF